MRCQYNPELDRWEMGSLVDPQPDGEPWIPEFEIDLNWKPTQWWRACAPDGSIWAESSDEQEVREMMRPGDTLWNLWRYEITEWREVNAPEQDPE